MMNDLWNNTCVLIDNNGMVILSNPMLKGHNEAISDCASRIGLDISPLQSMPAMLQTLAISNHVVLLNCGRVINNEGYEKRTGYLALPSNVSEIQLAQIENLKLLLDEYQSITVWKLENNTLKTKSMGDSKLAALMIQDMIDEVTNKNIENIQK